MTLATEKASWGYRDQVIIPPLDCTIDTSSIIAIIGPNGCGKSTLLRGLTGLLPGISGYVELDGKVVQDWPRKAFAKRIAVLAQSPSAPDGLTVRQLVEHGRFPHQGVFGQGQKDDREIVDWALSVVRLSHMQDRVFQSLSGGERQRGWIALALAQKSDMLFLDEPTTFLDIGHQLEILELLHQLNQELGLGIVMVLHDINHASMYADRIIAMKEGHIQADGSASQVINQELVQHLFNTHARIIEVDHNGGMVPFSIPLKASGQV